MFPTSQPRSRRAGGERIFAKLLGRQPKAYPSPRVLDPSVALRLPQPPIPDRNLGLESAETILGEARRYGPSGLSVVALSLLSPLILDESLMLG